ncbi:uncharacterized protein LOC105850835 isoform X3 [Hydra vulgaris]|uniref:Uncharacterized protein LOC105850835 isoform X3 n=1 Tax=Hydra vulgaris TaxID=6087 RepID=A0ABM4BKX3_HYDVU
MEFGRGRGLFKRILSDSPPKNVGYTDLKNNLGFINSGSLHENYESEKNLLNQLHQFHLQTELLNNGFKNKENDGIPVLNNFHSSNGFEINTVRKEIDNEINKDSSKNEVVTNSEIKKYPKINNGFLFQNAESILNVDQTEEVTIKQEVVDHNNDKATVDDKTIKAEEEWHLFKCDRRINKILSEVTENNIATVFVELEHLIEEGPLSSRYVNCSEVKQLIDVLIKKSIQNEDFLPYGPCLLKLVSEHSMIEFQKYFPDIIHAHRKENITICSTDNMLSTCGKHFCQLLGHMLSLPRQTCTLFYETVSSVVEECIERWSYPNSDEAELNGYHENLAIVFGLSIKCLLLEIIKRMISCDKVISKQMKKFVWFLRESILNKILSRNVREVFLDALIEVEVHSFKKHFGENGSSEDVEKLEIGDEARHDGDKARHETRHNEDKTKHDKATISASSEKFLSKKDDIFHSTSTFDQFLCVKQLLREQDVSELIPIFIKHGLDDYAIMLPTIKARMEAANIKRLTAFQIDTVIKKTNFQKLRERAVSSITTSLPHSPDNLDPAKVSFDSNIISDRNKLSFDQTKISSDSNKLSCDPMKLSPGSNNLSCDPMKLTSDLTKLSPRKQENLETSDTLIPCLVNDGNSALLNKTALTCNSTRKIAMNFYKSLCKPSDTLSSDLSELNSPNTVNENANDAESCFINKEVCAEIKVSNVFKNVNAIQNINDNFPISSTSANIDENNDDEPDVVIEDEQYENSCLDNSTVNRNIMGVSHSQYDIIGRGFIKRPEVSTSPSIHQNKYVNGSNYNVYRGNPRDRYLHKGQRGFNRSKGSRGYNKDFQKPTNSYNKRLMNKDIDKKFTLFERKFESESDNFEPNIEHSQPFAFGMRRPRACLRCQSNSHQSDDCNVNNPFFT